MDEWVFLTKDQKSVVVRHAKVADASEMFHCFCEVVQEGKWLPTTKPSSNQSEWARWIQRTYSNREVLLVARVEGEYAGHVSLQPEEWHASKHVARLGIIVRKHYRSKGVGRALMLAVEEAGRIQRYEKIVLSTFESNNVALGLYESLGYHIVGMREKHFLMPKGYINEVLMEKLIV